MKPTLHKTQNNLPEPIRRKSIDPEVSRGVDKLLWMVEAHAQSKD